MNGQPLYFQLFSLHRSKIFPCKIISTKTQMNGPKQYMSIAFEFTLFLDKCLHGTGLSYTFYSVQINVAYFLHNNTDIRLNLNKPVVDYVTMHYVRSFNRVYTKCLRFISTFESCTASSIDWLEIYGHGYVTPAKKLNFRKKVVMNIPNWLHCNMHSQCTFRW